MMSLQRRLDGRQSTQPKPAWENFAGRPACSESTPFNTIKNNLIDALSCTQDGAQSALTLPIRLERRGA
jgi:hypothetical protein